MIKIYNTNMLYILGFKMKNSFATHLVFL